MLPMPLASEAFAKLLASFEIFDRAAHIVALTEAMSLVATFTARRLGPRGLHLLVVKPACLPQWTRCGCSQAFP